MPGPESGRSGTHTAAAVITALIWIGGAFAAAGAVWGAALGLPISWAAIVGFGIGLIPSVTNGIQIGARDSAEERRAMTAAAAARWSPIALLIAILGAVVWGVRGVFF